MNSPAITQPTPIPPTNLPNGNVSVDTQTGITPNQYTLAPGETADAYNSRIAGLRTASGMPNTSGAPTDVTSAEDQVAQNLGYKSYEEAVTSLTAPPSKSETDLYNDAYSAAGLDGLHQTITSRQNDLNEAQNKIDDNPWLDEADRVGRNRTVQTLAQADIKNYQDEYDAKVKEVHDLVTRETADGTASTAANKAKLAALENQAKALATQAATAAKTAAAAPKTVKGANGATYQWDATSGTFKQILGAKAPASSTPKPPKDFAFTSQQLLSLQTQGLPKDHANTILSEINQGYSLEDIRQQIKASGLDPGLLDKVMLYVDPKNNTPAKATAAKTTTTTPVNQ